MMTETRIIIILLFALTFAFIGWASPVIFATYAPQEMIIESHGFTARDASTTSEIHLVCFDRTVKQPSSGEVFTELYLVDSGNRRIEMSSNHENRFFQQGRQEVVTPLQLPEHIQEGTYRYLLVVRMNLADGRVQRDFTFVSEPFEIDDSNENDIEESASC